MAAAAERAPLSGAAAQANFGAVDPAAASNGERSVSSTGSDGGRALVKSGAAALFGLAALGFVLLLPGHASSYGYGSPIGAASSSLAARDALSDGHKSSSSTDVESNDGAGTSGAGSRHPGGVSFANHTAGVYKRTHACTNSWADANFLQRYVGLTVKVAQSKTLSGVDCMVRTSGTTAGEWSVHDVQTTRFHSGEDPPFAVRAVDQSRRSRRDRHRRRHCLARDTANRPTLATIVARATGATNWVWPAMRRSIVDF
jgi:hypothetical protein